METLKLISEEIQDVEYITEQKEGGKKDYKIKGIFMQKRISRTEMVEYILWKF